MAGRVSQTPELHNQVSDRLWHSADSSLFLPAYAPVQTNMHTQMLTKKKKKKKKKEWLLVFSVFYVCVFQPEPMSYMTVIQISKPWVTFEPLKLKRVEILMGSIDGA